MPRVKQIVSVLPGPVDRYGIRPGDDMDWVEAGDVIRGNGRFLINTYAAIRPGKQIRCNKMMVPGGDVTESTNVLGPT